MDIRDRVKELRRGPRVPTAPNPKNWRTHSREQADASRGVLAEIGFAGAALARELSDGTLELIDGHLRAETSTRCRHPGTRARREPGRSRQTARHVRPVGRDGGRGCGKAGRTLGRGEHGQRPRWRELLNGLAHQNGGCTDSAEPDEPGGTDVIPEKYQNPRGVHDRAGGRQAAGGSGAAHRRGPQLPVTH